MRRVAIVGAGATGLAAAYDLTRQGFSVHLYEAGAEVGGLAAGFRDGAWDWTLEKFYHHWFANDDAVLRLIAELGWQDRLLFPRPTTSLWLNGKVYPMDRPNIVVANLRLPLSWPAKVRYGLTGLYLRLTRNWRPLERTTADRWLRRTMGREAYETLWRSLLIGKFGTYYDQVNMAWMWARIYKRTPRLGTFAGGFQAFLERLAERVQGQGAQIYLNTPVRRIEKLSDGKLAVQVEDRVETYDAVISTSSPQVMLRLAPQLEGPYAEKLASLKSMGAVVVIFALRHQLLRDGTYWLSLPASRPDKQNSAFPFLALVEHTNYMDAQHYGGDHLVYCGDYVTPDHEYLRLAEDELVVLFQRALSQFNPAFTPEWVRKWWVFRTPYAQPVPLVNQSQRLPDLRTSLAGLYLASMSQVYPWDRGTNYAIEMGRDVAALVAQDLASRGKGDTGGGVGKT